jgi:hypothetical protein
MKVRGSLLSSIGLAAMLVVAHGHAGAPSRTRLQYVGYLVDAPVLDARLELVRDGSSGPYRMSLSAGLVGGLGDMFQFHLDASTQGRFGAMGPQPTRYRNKNSIYDSLETVTLTYGADGSVTLEDQPRTQEGEDAVARGLLAGTLDPLSAALAMIDQAARGDGCVGTFRIFDGVRRYDLTLAPAPAGLDTPRLRAAPDAKATACDAAVTLVSGFPQYALDAGMYPKTARFWLARGIIGSSPTLLRMEAQSGLGRMRVDFRAVLPQS